MIKNSQKLIAALLTLGMILMTGCGQQQNSSGINTPNATHNLNSATLNTEITIEEAKEIALAKAGIQDAVFTKEHYDMEDADYEFEFYTENKEYECEVSAHDGRIKDYDVDKHLDDDSRHHN